MSKQERSGMGRASCRDILTGAAIWLSPVAIWVAGGVAICNHPGIVRPVLDGAETVFGYVEKTSPQFIRLLAPEIPVLERMFELRLVQRSEAPKGP